MSNNEFSYLEYLPQNTTPSSVTNNKKIKDQVNNTIRQFESSRTFGEELSYFKRQLRDTMVSKYERPVYLELENIKKRRGQKEYEEDIRRVFQTMTKIRENAEQGMIEVKRYLDYVEVKNGEESRVYLPGLEEKRQFGKFRLPDILGFTKYEAKAEQYRELVLLMARTLIGLDGTVSMAKSLEELKTIIDNEKGTMLDKMNMDLCDKFRNDKALKPLFKVDAYYELLLMMDSGNFDINKFLVKKEKGPSFDGDKGRNRRNRDRNFGERRDRGRDFGDRRNRDEDRKGSFFSGGGLFDKKKKGKKSESLFSLANRKGNRGNRGNRGNKDNTSKKLIFILKREGMRSGDAEELVNSILRKLKVIGYEIFMEKSIKPGDDQLKIVFERISKGKKEICESFKEDKTAIQSKLSSATSDKDKEKYRKMLKAMEDTESIGKMYENFTSHFGGVNTEKYSSIFNEVDKKKDVEFVDFYIGKVRYERNIFFGIKCNDIVKQYLPIYHAYTTFYVNYNYSYLPRSSDSATESEKTTVKIMNGMGIYLSTLREIILSIEKRLLTDPAFKKEEPKLNQQLAKKVNEKESDKEYLEYREILREIDKQIFEEKNSGKKERLIKLREEVIKKGAMRV